MLSLELLSTLAQRGGGGAQGAAGGGMVLIIQLAILIVVIVAWWKVFEKAGHPGWAAIIPFYNLYILCKVAGRPAWWLILLLIPFVNFIVLAIVSIDVAKSFGKGVGFGIGLWLLGFIFYPILGFGPAQYQGPKAG